MDAELYAIKQGEKTASKYLDIIISAVELNHIEFSTEKCQIGFSCKDGNSLLLMYPMNPTLIVGHIKAKGEIECFMNYDYIHLC